MAYRRPQRALIISTFPPKHCGIATYAQEHFLQLKREGYIVYTQGFADGSAANYNFSNFKWRGIVKAIILILFGRFDRVYLHFTNGVIWPRSHLSDPALTYTIILQYLWVALMGIRYGRRMTFIGHEINTGRISWKKRWTQGLVYMWMRNIHVHTEEEYRKFRETFGWFVPRRNIKVVDHARFMKPKYKGSRSEARYYLGIPDDQVMFLCIGFIQHTKGFDQVVESMTKVTAPSRHLYVVGSIRVEAKEHTVYMNHLKSLIDATPYATLVERFLDDREFDMWITAADHVVLPYREIWSSGVGARARMMGTPVVFRNHINLLSQFKVDDTYAKIYDSPEGLTALLNTLEKKPHIPQRSVPLHAHKNPQLAALQIYKEKKFLFVMPCFGERVKGGAESFVFTFAQALAARGAKIEVWSSDSSHVVGRNRALAREKESHLPFKVRRFPANVRQERLFNFVHRYMNQEERCGKLFQWIWVKTNLHGEGMEDALRHEGHRFDVIQIFHYLLGSSHRLSGIFPHKTVLHPFIHNEAPARNPVMRHLFAGSRGVTCNSGAERHIALLTQCGLLPSLYHPIGNGVEDPLFPAENHCSELDQCEDGFLLFVGRMIPEKNLQLLFQWHEQYSERHPRAPTLVCIGDGPMGQHPIFSAHPKFKYLGWVDGPTKRYAYQNAKALVNLSLLESFSLVMMEAWLEKTPVIVHKECEATYSHIERSGGGFGISSAQEYSEVIGKLAASDSLRAELGTKGRAYVRENYSWDHVCANYAIAVSSILEWKRDGLRLVTEMAGVVSALPSAYDDIVVKTLLGKDFYARYEEKDRDGRSVPASWEYYVTDHLHKFKKDAVIVDIGAGRGHFLNFLRAKMPNNFYLGIEPDKESFQQMMQKGIPAACMDLREFSDVVEPGTIDCAFMLHVVEHIPWPELIKTFEDVRKLLKVGGLFIVELPNGWSMLTNAIYFWRDPTHIRPLIPSTLEFTLQSMGFKVWDNREFAPHLNADQKAKLESAIGSADMVKAFYGNQDVCLVCQRVT